MGLTIDSRQLEQAILKAIVSRFNKGVRSALPTINKRIKELIKQKIESSPAYQSIGGNAQDDLQAEFGIRNPKPILQEIVKVIQNEMEADFVPFQVSGKNISGGVSWRILKSSYEGILQVAGTSYDSYNRGRNTKFRIEWLKWLLTAGDKIIFFDTHIDFVDDPNSRSGKALMFAGGSWRVPPRFSGISGANFLTKALNVESIKKDFIQIISEEITRRL